jgi:hypothetical protein
MPIDFGSIDPAAFILALLALFIGLDSVLKPLCNYVRVPRKAYTIFYRDSMIIAHESSKTYDHDWVLSIAVSRAAFMGLWSWNNWHTFGLIDTPIGLGQWILYPTSQTGSGTLTALMIIVITPIWLIKYLYIRLMLLIVKIDFHGQTRQIRISKIFGLKFDTPTSFHLRVLNNMILTLGHYDLLYSETAKNALSRCALSLRFPLGAGTLAFSHIGSSGSWTGVFYDLAKFGHQNSPSGYKTVKAGNIKLSLKDGSFLVSIPAFNAYVGCTAGSKHGDVAQMVRVLISHGLSDPIDLIISTWGISRQQIDQIRFTHMMLQGDLTLKRRFSSTKHWINRKVRLTKKLRRLSATSPWCDCRRVCYCSLLGIMLTPPLKRYHNVRGAIVTNDVNRAVNSQVIKNSGAVILDNKIAVELLEDVSLVLVGNHTRDDGDDFTVLHIS